MAIWSFCGNLVWFTHFGKLYQEKSGNPGPNVKKSIRNGRREIKPLSLKIKVTIKSYFGFSRNLLENQIKDDNF
jgi:hypothetical protein